VNDVVWSWPDWARANFTVKPRMGTSGRGRVRGKDGVVVHQGELDMRGGAIVEPWFKRAWDLSSQWFIDAHGEPHHLGNTLQNCKPSGLYLGCEILKRDGRFTSSITRGGHDYDDELTERTRALVEEAAKVGYRGPCGVDGLTWRDDRGVEHLRPIVELNARFTAGTIALGLAMRADLRDGQHAIFRLDTDQLLTIE
jgi:hypothetical protein